MTPDFKQNLIACFPQMLQANGPAGYSIYYELLMQEDFFWRPKSKTQEWCLHVNNAE
jgi:hypothetical protein